MPIKQTSKIQVRSGLQQNLPQLAQGEMAWAVDSQRLFIGNGNVSSGAPYEGNTEIITVVSNPTPPALIPVAGVFQQTPDGSRTQFWTVGNVAPLANTAIVWNNFPLVPNNGYNMAGYTVNFVTAPSANANLYWQGWIN